MAHEIDIYLDLTKQQAKVPRFLMQREVDAKQLNFIILDNGMNVDISYETLTLCMEKPDGEIIYNSITISDGEAGEAYIVLTSQCQSAVGTAKCWVKMIDGTSVTYSPKFEIEILEVTDFAAAVESTSEFSDLDADIAQIAGFEVRISAAESDIDDLETADGQNVKITGAQTIAGVKTLTSSPIIPTPTTDMQAAPKKYVDDGLVNLGGLISVADTTYYVATTGSDSNDGLSSGNAFLTINKALGMIPPILTHTYTINVAAGTYAEVVSISNIMGTGVIQITGASNYANCGSYQIIRFKAEQVSPILRLFGFEATNATSTGNSFDFYYCGCLYVAYCKTLGADKYGFFTNFGTVGRIYHCGCSNSTGAALDVEDGCQIASYVWEEVGSGNTVGLRCVTASIIGKNSTQPQGTTAESALAGGTIV